MLLRRRALVLAAALAALAACSQTEQTFERRNLDRPSDMVFTCFGDYRIVGDPDDETDDVLVVSGQPLAGCQSYAETGEPAPGQEELVTPSFFGFALQTVQGTIAVVEASIATGDTPGFATAAVLDTDELTPGKNAIPIGVLPVALATDPQGCHVVSANAGGCDLSIIDVNTAVDPNVPALVSRIPVVDAGGAPLLARPETMVGQPVGGVVGEACPEAPTGLVYIAYPDCNLVATVDPATGQVVAGVRFNADGTIELTDGNVSCPAQCGGSEAPSGDGERPVALAVQEDGQRLYVGADNSATLTIVELDDAGLPESYSRVVLEGDIGIEELAVTPVINMGGSLGLIGGGAGQFRFVYAIATDATVRVADVHNLNVECDTQVDPRYIHDVRDVSFLSCMPVGGVDTPPRRAGAISPGIHVPFDSVPLDVSIVTVDTERGSIGPYNTVGHFAIVSSSDGLVFVVNIDDDRYPDFENPDDVTEAFVSLAIAHQIRDRVNDRSARSFVTDPDDPENTLRTCNSPVVDQEQLELGPRLSGGTAIGIDDTKVSTAKLHQVPLVRQERCVYETNGLETSVSELSFMASDLTREQAYPDLMALPTQEQWSMVWEGRLSRDDSNVAIDGPPVRRGVARIEDGKLLIDDGGRPFCRMGVQPYDIVTLRGCDPSRDSDDCGLGQECFVHPDSPLLTGMCLPEGRSEALQSLCRDTLVTRRRYTVREARAGELVLSERRDVLRSTPLDGCVSAAECDDLWRVEQEIASDEQPGLFSTSAEPPGFACELDPSRAGDVPRCVRTCEAESDCDDGFLCIEGRCIEGAIPPPECVEALQRYDVRAGEAFAVIGSRSGFLHSIIADETTGECIEDPEGHPLHVGRVPLRPPPCVGDGYTDVSPNPCSTTIEDSRFAPDYANPSTCVLRTDGAEDDPDGDPARRLVTAEVPAIRFQNPGVRFHLINVETTGDDMCIGDRGGASPAFSPLHTGYEIQLTITAGFLPLFIPIEPVYPQGVVTGPDGGIWIMDAGDFFAPTYSTGGQIFRFDPANIGAQPTRLQ